MLFSGKSAMRLMKAVLAASFSWIAAGDALCVCEQAAYRQFNAIVVIVRNLLYIVDERGVY
jgi:hypothetical protein